MYMHIGFFFGWFFSTSMDNDVSVCFGVFVCVDVERWSFQRRRLEDFIVLFCIYNELDNSHLKNKK